MIHVCNVHAMYSVNYTYVTVKCLTQSADVLLCVCVCVCRRNAHTPTQYKCERNAVADLTAPTCSSIRSRASTDSADNDK